MMFYFIIYFIYLLIILLTNNFIETGDFSTKYDDTILVSTSKGFYTHKLHITVINNYYVVLKRPICPPQPIPVVEPVIETSFLFQRICVVSFGVYMLYYILSGICS